MPSTDQDTTPPISRYTKERIEALAKRNAFLEHNIEAAIAALGSRPDPDEHLSGVVQGLTSALQDTFRSTLLCSSDTTDEQLDYWIPEIEKHEAQAAESEEA